MKPTASGMKPDGILTEELSWRWLCVLICGVPTSAVCSSDLHTLPYPTPLALRITTAPSQPQEIVPNQKSLPHPGPGRNPCTKWAGLSKDSVLENGIRPGQSGGQWLAGAGLEVEGQSWSSHCLTCAFNQTKTSCSVTITKREADAAVGAWHLPPSPQQLWSPWDKIAHSGSIYTDSTTIKTRMLLVFIRLFGIKSSVLF